VLLQTGYSRGWPRTFPMPDIEVRGRRQQDRLLPQSLKMETFP
jgi:hypothetical protein